MTDLYEKFLGEFTYDCVKHELGDPTEWAERRLQNMTRLEMIKTVLDFLEYRAND